LAVKSRTFAMTNSRLNLRMCSPPTSESGRRWHLRKPALLCWGARARSPSAPTAEHPRGYADHPLSVGKGAVRCSRRVRGVLALRVSTLQRRWEPLTLLLRGRSCEPERRPRLEWPWPLDGRADPKDRYQLLRVLFAGSVAGTGRRSAHLLRAQACGRGDGRLEAGAVEARVCRGSAGA
jgi:hypothetical protein